SLDAGHNRHLEIKRIQTQPGHLPSVRRIFLTIDNDSRLVESHINGKSGYYMFDQVTTYFYSEKNVPVRTVTEDKLRRQKSWTKYEYEYY
ncbi:MAG TPA: hypothetical protein VFU15_02360, partial [Bacteroidia bacterium]|nr:hypothetical protein [Bacteroidia bacterium]